MTENIRRQFRNFLVVAAIALIPGALFAAVELKEVQESAVELVAFVFGGIGIFLVGIIYAGSHLRKITGGVFQNIVSRLSGHHAGMFLSGASLGFMTQSGKAAAFILSDFVQANTGSPFGAAAAIRC